jgi:hypothetical protein
MLYEVQGIRPLALTSPKTSTPLPKLNGGPGQRKPSKRFASKLRFPTCASRFSGVKRLAKTRRI